MHSTAYISQKDYKKGDKIYFFKDKNQKTHKIKKIIVSNRKICVLAVSHIRIAKLFYLKIHEIKPCSKKVEIFFMLLKVQLL